MGNDKKMHFALSTLLTKILTYIFQFISFEENFIFRDRQGMKKHFQSRDVQICSRCILDLFSIATKRYHSITLWIIIITLSVS